MIIVEGFEKTGKSTFINNNYPNHDVYRMSYEDFDFSNRFSMNQIWVVLLAIKDFLNQRDKDRRFSDKVVFDRSFPSSYVYDKLYPDEHKVDDHIIKSFLKMSEDLGCKIDYLFHDDKELARKIYLASDNRYSDGHTDKLDKFHSFDHYWEVYQTADNLFTKFFAEYFTYSEIQVNFIGVSSQVDPKEVIV